MKYLSIGEVWMFCSVYLGWFHEGCCVMQWNICVWVKFECFVLVRVCPVDLEGCCVLPVSKGAGQGCMLNEGKPATAAAVWGMENTKSSYIFIDSCGPLRPAEKHVFHQVGSLSHPSWGWSGGCAQHIDLPAIQSHHFSPCSLKLESWLALLLYSTKFGIFVKGVSLTHEIFSMCMKKDKLEKKS